jgi:hypothetical protein
VGIVPSEGCIVPSGGCIVPSGGGGVISEGGWRTVAFVSAAMAWKLQKSVSLIGAYLEHGVWRMVYEV